MSWDSSGAGSETPQEMWAAQGLLDEMDRTYASKSRIQAAADALVVSGMVPKRVIIEVNDGVARVSYVSPGVEVQIIDHDPDDAAPVIVPLGGDPWGQSLPDLNVCRCVEESDCPHDWRESDR